MTGIELKTLLKDVLAQKDAASAEPQTGPETPEASDA